MQGTQALLELKAGLENMASKGNIKVILVQYKVIKKSKVKELKQAKAALTIIKWKGEKSKFPKGRFWKELQLELPVKKIIRSSSPDGQEPSYVSLRNVWCHQQKKKQQPNKLIQKKKKSQSRAHPQNRKTHQKI